MTVSIGAHPGSKHCSSLTITVEVQSVGGSASSTQSLMVARHLTLPLGFCTPKLIISSPSTSGGAARELTEARETKCRRLLLMKVLYSKGDPQGLGTCAVDERNPKDRIIRHSFIL